MQLVFNKAGYLNARNVEISSIFLGIVALADTETKNLANKDIFHSK